MAALTQQSGCDETVAAVVAGSAEHGDGCCLASREAGGGFCHCGAGVLHQHQAGHAGSDGQRVGLAHLGCGEKLVARQDSSWG